MSHVMSHAMSQAACDALATPRHRPVRAQARSPRLRPLALALLLAWAASPPAALAQAQGSAQNRNTLPTGMAVVQGQASTAVQGNRLTITNSANAQLNWQTFSIGAGASVRFEQPSAESRVLNRVVGNDPSALFGQLSSNGQVWLLNPNGVLFGRDARVDVAGLVASTLNLLPADWQAGRLLLRATASDPAGASVVNQGELRSTYGGHVLLIGGAGGVRNDGRIETPGGSAALLAARSIDVVDSGTPNVTLRIDTPQGSAANLGSLLAPGGRIDLAAAIVNQSGIVRADSLDGRAGQVTLRAADAVELTAGSITSAAGREGGPAGRISVDSGASGLTRVAGELDARSDVGPGGRIELLGERVALLDGASADVSGRTGGGELFVGGGALGRDPALRNARASYIARGARLTADATVAGDGGRIVVWGNEATRAYGRFSARGGAEGGNGGLVETSGGWLDARPASMRTDAPRGRAGQWLLDPYDLTITDAANVPRTAADQNIDDALDPPTRYFEPNNTPSYLTSETITAALNSGSNVSVSTSGTTGTGFGQITIDKAHISVAPSQPVSLSIAALGALVMSDSRIASTGQPLDVRLSVGDLPLASASIPGQMRFSNASIDTAGLAFAGTTRGVIDLSAGTVQFDSGTSLTSRASGNAITLHRGSNANLDSFTNNAGSAALATPNGRWRIYLSDPFEGYVGGGLDHGATIYGTTYPGTGTPDLPGSNLLLYSYQPALYQTGDGTAISRVYDGSTRVIVSDSGQIGGMVNGDRIIGFFTNANVGGEKTIELFPGNAPAQGIDSAGKPVYGYDAEAIGLTAVTNPFTLIGSVTPRVVTVNGATAANKLYDGSTTATISAWQLGNVVAGDQVSVGSSRAAFADPAIGSNKPVTATALALSGASSDNYVLSEGRTVTTQASILAPQPDDRTVLKAPPMLPVERPAGTTDGRALDATGAMRFDADGRSTFGAIDLAKLPSDRVAAILETRQRYKDSAFAGALQQLEVDPSLADAPACLTIAQVSSGACLVTSELKAAAGPREPASVAALPADGSGAAAPATTPAPAAPAAPAAAPAANAPTAAKPAAPRPAAAARPSLRIAAVPQIQRKIAVIIGIDRYADARIPSLDGAVKDATAVAEVFSSKLGYETLLIQDASREAIFRALNRLALQARPEDSVLIYYAGHGDLIEKTRTGYWIPANAAVDRPQTWISNNDIGRLLSLISASQVALVSDSCFSGSLVAGDVRSAADTDAGALLRHRSAVVMSSGGNEPVADLGKNGHSPFAWNLMRNLEKVTSWRPGSNVFEQVRQAVVREVPQHPRYGPAVAGRHEAGGDYLFETRQYE